MKPGEFGCEAMMIALTSCETRRNETKVIRSSGERIRLAICEPVIDEVVRDKADLVEKREYRHRKGFGPRSQANPTTSAISHADSAAEVIITLPSDSSNQRLKPHLPQTNH